jgi:hypothetical protein
MSSETTLADVQTEAALEAWFRSTGIGDYEPWRERSDVHIHRRAMRAAIDAAIKVTGYRMPSGRVIAMKKHEHV